MSLPQFIVGIRHCAVSSVSFRCNRKRYNTFNRRKSIKFYLQKQKAPLFLGALFVINQKLNLAVDGRSNHCYRGDITGGQVEGEVVSVALVHHFHTQVCAVDHISPSVDDATLRVDNRLVEVETVEVEGHRGNTHSGLPDTDNWPCT